MEGRKAEAEDMAGGGTAVTSWKLYDNPFYNHHHRRRHRRRSSSNSVRDQSDCAQIPLPARKLAASLRDLTTFLQPAGGRAEEIELKAELEVERGLRKNAEALNREVARELSDERTRREAKERACEELAAEVSRRREEMNLLGRSVEEEMAKMRVPEEKLPAMEESPSSARRCGPLRAGEEAERGASATTSLPNTASIGSDRSGGAWGLRRSHHLRKEIENPHIRRGMKGFVEFPRGPRVRAFSSPCSRESEEDPGAKVDCQMAQLRVLLKGRTPPGSTSSRLDPLLA
ncbi:unnamed protein product [Spirodela intermedia]|uniref:Uncharacterized protein n=1 Tax=Spirodela intermedia TaxID=51605 RepID=A0A7I8IE37_SPIIN|nr:unnamed protein product [Spirodela intermedia]CAA6655891.1 unnamed protein product [Spirodela intermedia]